MATRMQQRRGTAAQWVSTNGGDGPILEAGEIGFETDTGKFKIGNGVDHWVDLDYFLDESDITGITGDYVLANTLGQANGVATLDANAKLTASQIPGIDELAQDAVDMALVAGTGISKTYNDNANTITIAVDTSVIATKAELAEVSQDSLNDALTAGTGITKSYDDNANTLTVAVDTSVIQARVSGVSDTEIGYLANVTSDIQTQLNAKASSTDLSNHESDTSNVHGIADTTALVKTTDTGTVTSTMIADGTIVNDDINASAAIALSKLATDPLARANHTGTQLANTISDFNEAAQDAVGEILGSGLTYTDASNTITVDSSVVQLRVANVTDTEIGYLDGVTSNVQAQLDAKAALAGAAFTGNISTTGDLQVDGNFTVNGSNVLVSATQIQIEDSIVQLAHQNPANTVDLGIVAGYNDGSAKHAGLVKDATDGKWKLFDGVTDEPSTTVNFAQASYDDLVVGGLEATSLTVGNVSNTEFGYLDGVTSAIQTQLDNKASLTGTETLTNKTISSPTISSPIIVANPSLQGETTSAPTFVSISQSSTTAASSTDGITWTVRTLPTDSSWDSVTYGNNTFVSVSYSTTAASSADGITWTVRTLPASADWRSVTFGNNTFVVVAYDSANAASSTDGITWTLRTMPANNYWRSVTFGNNTFVSVAGFSSAAASSTDGITWTLGTLPLESVWFSVAFGNNTFVATSFTSAAASSTDGITWTLRTMPVSGSWRSVTFGNNTFVAVARISTNAATSTDGITWTVRTLPASTEWRSVTFGNNTFVVVAYNSTTAASSTDGITWTLRTMPSSNSWNSVAYGIASSTTPVTLSINGSTGTNGQVLQSTGTGIQWGTVAGYSAPTLGSTSIASGATVTTIAGLTLTAPTLTGTVNASGDINLSAVNGPGSLVDELALLMMGAL